MVARAKRFDPFDPETLISRESALGRSYEASKKHFWNDTDVLDGLIAKHGKPKLPLDKKESLETILSPIYHGEIVALHISAQLLTRVPDLEAQKVLAAQVFEEAKHVTAFQRYFREAGLDIPACDPWARRMLEGVRGAGDLSLKLLGMQLLTENLAHAVFRNLVEKLEEPVLKGMLEYIDRDEVKHVGLARNYLPVLLGRVRVRDLPGMWRKQVFWNFCIMLAVHNNRSHAENLGIDVNETLKREFRELNRLVRGLGSFRQRLPIATLPDEWNDWLVDKIFPSWGGRAHDDGNPRLSVVS